MKLSTLVMICVLIFGASICTLLISDQYMQPKEIIVVEYDAFVREGKHFGFDLDPDKLHYGNVCKQGCSTTRSIEIVNNDTYVKRVEFKIQSINSTLASSFVITPPTGSLLQPNQTKKFKVILTPTWNDRTGYHEGKIVTYIYKAWPFEKGEQEILPLPECFSTDMNDIIHCNKKRN